jgi:hypothetical protein
LSLDRNGSVELEYEGGKDDACVEFGMERRENENNSVKYDACIELGV